MAEGPAKPKPEAVASEATARRCRCSDASLWLRAHGRLGLQGLQGFGVGVREVRIQGNEEVYRI